MARGLPPGGKRQAAVRFEDMTPLNNNRGGGNNRRRGRGNNRQQGGGQPINRIDSRARGNAPQMLEKYRKLAHDAHLNGDRVTEEYYLQFADHYFRVTADARVRQDESRQRRDGAEGGEGWRDEPDDAGDFNVENEYSQYDPQSYSRRDRDDRPRREPGEDRPRREQAEDRPEQPANVEPAIEPVEAVETGAAIEADTPNLDAPANPFLRDGRSRGLRPRREDRRPRRDEPEAAAAEEPAAFDPASLPPSISIPREEPVPSNGEAVEADAEPKVRRRARRKPADDDAGEALQSVG